jgi:VCBS repeat protein
VAAGDVNGDNRSDVYVMRVGKGATRANAPDRVFLNDGEGTAFTRISWIPSTSEGMAESVWPIDYDRNGLTDFLALNGRERVRGPVQLIAFFRAPYLSNVRHGFPCLFTLYSPKCLGGAFSQVRLALII